MKTCCQDRLSLNAGRKYCRMLQGEDSAILSTFIKLPFVFNGAVTYELIKIKEGERTEIGKKCLPGDGSRLSGGEF